MNLQPSILIVNDEIVTRKFVEFILRNLHYQYYVAGSSNKALQTLKQHPTIDVILLDIMMPDLDGLETLAIIKQNPATAPIKVIMLLTAINQASDIVKAFSLGAGDYLLKPFKNEELVARLNTQFQLKKAEDELKAQTRYLECLNTISHLGNQMLSLHDLLQKLVLLLKKLLNTDWCFISLWDESKAQVELVTCCEPLLPASPTIEISRLTQLVLNADTLTPLNTPELDSMKTVLPMVVSVAGLPLRSSNQSLGAE